MNSFVNYVVREPKGESKTVLSLTSALASGRLVKAVTRIPMLECSSPDELVGFLLVLCEKSVFTLSESTDASDTYVQCSDRKMDVNEVVKFLVSKLADYRNAVIYRDEQGVLTVGIDTSSVEYKLCEC